MSTSFPARIPHIVHVHVLVKPEAVESFISATLVNVAASREEPGVLQFDLLQQHDDPTRFVLVEIYRNTEAPALHKATAHYAAWRDAVAPWMESPRVGLRMIPHEPPV